jgi:ketosteroid isomerase-like protein
MKGHRGSSDVTAATMLVLLVVVAALALAACGGSSTTSSAASMTTPSATTPPPATSSAAASNPAQVARTESVIKALMATWNNAWSANKDRDALSSFFADDVQYYDATIAEVISKSDMNDMGKDPDWWKSFRLKLKSFFVSPDGRFAATLGRIAIRDDAGKLPWQPAASVMAIANGKIEWEYDYYGGEQGTATQTKPLLNTSRSAGAAGSAAAQSAVAEASDTIEKWVAAYNGRDAEAFLSAYAENAKCIDVVSPRWRVMTKGRLATDVASRFAMTDFASKLEPSLGSAMELPFFVSADGRYSAVQGGIGTGSDVPMLVVLELKAGKIVRQYNYSAIDRSLLTP